MFHVINYSHPLTDNQMQQLAAHISVRGTMYGPRVTSAEDVQVHEVKCQFDLQGDLREQVRELVSRDHAIAGHIFVLPRLTEAAALVLYEIQRQKKYKSPIYVIQLRPVAGALTPTFELAAVLEVGRGIDVGNVNPVPPQDSPFYTPPGAGEYDLDGQRYRVARVERTLRVESTHDLDTDWVVYRHSVWDKVYLVGLEKPVSALGHSGLQPRISGNYATSDNPLVNVTVDEWATRYTSAESRRAFNQSLGRYYSQGDEVYDPEQGGYVDRRY